MKKLFLSTLLLALPLLAIAQEITVENSDGIRITYKYIKNGTELEVARAQTAEVVNIPEEVTYMSQTMKVTSIGSQAFQYKSSLISVTIPNSITNIGNRAFRYCKSLTFVTIPNTITNIGERTFEGCKSMTSIIIPNSVTTIENYAFFECTGLTSVNIPNSVTTIGPNAFSSCSGLTMIAIPDGVSELGEMAFMNCSNLTSINIPDGVKELGVSTFQGCSSLSTVAIPNSVTMLEYGVFSQCRSLTSATIGSSVNTIKKNSFTDCQALADVYCLAENVPSTDLYAFDSYIQQAILHVPSNAVDAYMAQEPWRFFQSIVPLDDESIGTIFYNSPTSGSTIDVYSIDGKFIGSATTPSEATDITKHLSSGTTVIIRMGGKSVKVVVK